MTMRVIKNNQIIRVNQWQLSIVSNFYDSFNSRSIANLTNKVNAMFPSPMLSIPAALLIYVACVNASAQDHPKQTKFEQYKTALEEAFNPLFDKSQLSGGDAYCSLLFHVNEDGGIKQVQAKECDLTGAWQQSIINAAAKLKISGKLPPPDTWEKFGIQEVIFFRSNERGTTVNPPIGKPIQSIVPTILPPKATTSWSDSTESNEKSKISPPEKKIPNNGDQIKRELRESETYQGTPTLKEKLLAEAKKAGGASQNCPTGAPRLDIDATASYLARSDNISFEIAREIESFTTKKSLKSEAVEAFNYLVGISNDLKKWGDSNRVLGACGTKSIIERISKENAARNELFKQFRTLLSPN
jgi:hypothetical protein